MRKAARWTVRIVLAVLALAAALLVTVVVVVNTDYGRAKLKTKLESVLDAKLQGGARIGSLEGNPFGELVLRDVVIDGPDGRPAITVKTMRANVSLIGLLRDHITIRELVIEDVDVRLDRQGNGQLTVAQLLKPQPHKHSNWTVDLGIVQIRRAHVLLDTGTEDLGTMNIDDIRLDAHGYIHRSGHRAAGITLVGMWREKQAPVSLFASLHATQDRIDAPLVALSIGGITAVGSDLVVMPHGQPPGGPAEVASEAATPSGAHLPQFAGLVHVAAKQAEVRRLLPRIDLPADIELAVRMERRETGAMPMALVARVDGTAVTGNAIVNLYAHHITGQLDVGKVDITKLTHGDVVANATGKLTFDVTTNTKHGDLPAARATLAAHGTYQTYPPADLVATIDTQGNTITALADVKGAANGRLRARVDRVTGGFVLQRASLVASTRDPAHASGGKAPVHGEVDVSLVAHGRLSPHAELAVAGTVRGEHLRTNGVAAATLVARVDANQLPAQPRGKLHVDLTQLAHGNVQLDAVAIDAATRSDGTIGVRIVSAPSEARYAVDVAAVVSLPKREQPLAIALEHHRIRAGHTTDWVGTGGRVIVGADRIEVRDLRSQSRDGKLALSATYGRSPGTRGDLTASLDVASFSLDALNAGYVGVVTGKADVARRSGRWTGTASANGKGLIVSKTMPQLDVDAKVGLEPGAVHVTGSAAGARLGRANVDVTVATPARLEDVTAWKRRGRDAIRSAKLELVNLDLNEIGIAARSPNTYAGRVTGRIDVTPTDATATFTMRGVRSSRIAGIRSIDGDLKLTQPSPNQLAPTATLAVADVGKATASAVVQIPAHPFDPAEWKQLGTRVVRTASVRTDAIAIDPALLARLGVTARLRTKASIAVDLDVNTHALRLTAKLDDLRGTPIAQPVDVELDATADHANTIVKLAMTSNKHQTLLLGVDGKVLVSLEALVNMLRGDRRALRTLPVTATLELPKTPAAQLLEVFGRTELEKGTVDGVVKVDGTLGAPRIAGRVTGTELAAQGSTRYHAKVIRKIVVDGVWTGTRGKLVIDGTEDDNSSLSVVADLAPHALADSIAIVKAKGFDVTPLLAFSPGVIGASRGMLDANLTVRGFDPRTAKIIGEVHVREARIPIAPTVGTLRQANIDIKVAERNIEVAVTGKLGAGDVKLAGTIGLDGVALHDGALKIALHDVSPIGSVEPQINANVDVKLARKDQQWTADIVVHNGKVIVPKKSGEKLKPIGAPQDLRIGGKRQKQSGPPPKPTAPVIVATITIEPARVESEEVRTSIKGKVVISADAKGVGIVGTIVARGGEVDLFGRRYLVEHGAVAFDGSVDPLLDIRITHDFPEATTITDVRGRLSKPELVLSADPGSYTQSQLLGFLLGGEPGGDPANGSTRDKAENLGTSIIANQIGGYVRKMLPFDIDVIRYEAASVSSSAAITVGTWLTHTLFFAFRQHMDARPDENSGEGTLEYWITSRLEVEATAGDRGYDGVDLLWRKRF